MKQIFKSSAPAILVVTGLVGSVVSILTGLDGLAEQIAVTGIVAFSFSIVFFYLGKHTTKQNWKNLRGRKGVDLLDIESADYYKDIFFSGPTLAVVSMRHEFFRSVISKGGTIRMIIPDPDARSVAQCAVY